MECHLRNLTLEIGLFFPASPPGFMKMSHHSATKKERQALEQNVIIVTDSSGPEFEDLIGKGLDEFNEQAAGLNDRRDLCVIVKDANSNAVLGGAVGRTSLGLAFLDLFHLPTSLRGSGLGTKILKAFEEEACKRGCSAAVLYTLSFQAPGFYEKNGWVSFGEIESKPGIRRVFMTKKLR